MAHPHKFPDYCRIAGYYYCSGCGVLRLRNKQTEKHFNKPCPGAE